MFLIFKPFIIAFAPPGSAIANPFCARYHPIQDKDVYDVSGPLLDQTGKWHTWDDWGGWSHWTSNDLIHWEGTFDKASGTGFGGLTGSVSPTPSGIYALWPSGEPIGSAKATNASMVEWEQRGPTISMPSRINTGFRDPTRAFQFGGKWLRVQAPCWRTVLPV
jgi:hypothetical protein